MKILVYGAGVLGSIFAARLHKGGHEVSLLARGQRLADLREHGIVLVEDLTGEQQVEHVPLVETLKPNDAYDLVLVIMRKNQVAAVLPALAANQYTPNVAFLGNNATGADAYVAALGRERVLMGFAGAGGGRDGYTIHHIRGTDTRPASLIIGELDGQSTPRLEAIVTAFKQANFKVEVSPNVDAWLKAHAAFVSPIADAIALAGNDNYRLSRTRDGLVLMIRAVRETADALRTLEIPVTPRWLAVAIHLPEPILVPLVARLMNTRYAEIGLSRHAKAASDEMQTLAAEVRSLVLQAGIPTPNLDRLSRYLDTATPTMPEGSHGLGLHWNGLIWGLVMTLSIMCLPMLRQFTSRRHKLA